MVAHIYSLLSFLSYLLSLSYGRSSAALLIPQHCGRPMVAPTLSTTIRTSRCRPLLSRFCHPSVGSADSSPLWESYCLSLRRGGTQCRSGGSYLFSIIFSLLSIISFVRAVIGRPFNTSTLRATNGRPYNTIVQTVYAILNYLICSATISSTLANASSILLASLPPPCAISGLPPPRPPATAVISLIILPQ